MYIFPSSKRPRAFTLVELLVVIAIIGVLIALLLPAVQKVRESSNRVKCESNLHNIALAAHGYQSTYGTLPSGYDKQQLGVLVYLLPFLEQEGVFRQFNGGIPPLAGVNSTGLPDNVATDNVSSWAAGDVYTPFWIFPAIVPPETDTSSFPSGMTAESYPTNADIPVFICPTSEPRSTQLYCFMSSDYTSPESTKFYNGFAFLPTTLAMGRTHYVGVACIGAGWTGISSKSKALFDYNSSNSLANVPDGTSNTLLFGECSGWKNILGEYGITTLNIPPNGGWFGTAWTNGVLWTDYGLQNTIANASYMTGATDSTGQQNLKVSSASGINRTTYNNFVSQHAGGRLPFAFADGSVRQIDPNIDFFIYIALGGFADGVSVSVAE